MKNYSILIISLIFSQHINAQIEEGCEIANYPFNSNAENTISTNYHGTVNGAVLSEDRDLNPNSAYEFDGVDDYISINNQPVINSSNFTITAWANMAGSGGGTHAFNPIFVQRNSDITSTSSLIALFAETQNNEVSFMVRNQNSGISPITVSSSTVNYNEWHFYAAVKDSTSLTLYIDSVEVGSVPCSILGSYNTITDNTDIGRHYYSGAAKSFFNGKIDDVEIHNCALSEDEILDIYNPIVKPPVSIVEENKAFISFYPNPVSNELHVENLNKERGIIEIYSIQGQHLSSHILNERVSIDISQLPNSAYIIKLIQGSNNQYYKFVKQ